MESTNNKFKGSLLYEEDEHLSSFRKRNNRLIIILLCLIVLVGLIMGAIIISLSHDQYIDTSIQIHSNLAVNSFCSYSHLPFYCSNQINYKIKPKAKTDPNQLFSLSLDIAIEELTSTTPRIDNQTESAFKNCSSLVQDSLSQLTQALGMFRVNPDVRKHTDEQRSDMMNWIVTAEQDLRSCYDDLAKIESPAVTEIRAELDQARIYVSNISLFLLNYRSVFFEFNLAPARRNSFDFRIAIALIRRWNMENAFNLGIIVLQYLFLIGLFCSLFCLR